MKESKNNISKSKADGPTGSVDKIAWELVA